MVLKRGRGKKSRMSVLSGREQCSPQRVSSLCSCFCQGLKHCYHFYIENVHSYCNMCGIYVEAGLLEMTAAFWLT